MPAKSAHESKYVDFAEVSALEPIPPALLNFSLCGPITVRVAVTQVSVGKGCYSIIGGKVKDTRMLPDGGATFPLACIYPVMAATCAFIRADVVFDKLPVGMLRVPEGSVCKSEEFRRMNVIAPYFSTPPSTWGNADVYVHCNACLSVVRDYLSALPVTIPLTSSIESKELAVVYDTIADYEDAELREIFDFLGIYGSPMAAALARVTLARNWAFRKFPGLKSMCPPEKKLNATDVFRVLGGDIAQALPVDGYVIALVVYWVFQTCTTAQPNIEQFFNKFEGRMRSHKVDVTTSSCYLKHKRWAYTTREDFDQANSPDTWCPANCDREIWDCVRVITKRASWNKVLAYVLTEDVTETKPLGLALINEIRLSLSSPVSWLRITLEIAPRIEKMTGPEAQAYMAEYNTLLQALNTAKCLSDGKIRLGQTAAVLIAAAPASNYPIVYETHAAYVTGCKHATKTKYANYRLSGARNVTPEIVRIATFLGLSLSTQETRAFTPAEIQKMAGDLNLPVEDIEQVLASRASAGRANIS